MSIISIVLWEIPARWRVMVPPDLSEWVPISRGYNPNCWNPILVVWERRREVIWRDLMDCGDGDSDDDGVG